MQLNHEATKYAAQLDTLPKDAWLSSSFGWPGEGGYTEIWRCEDGRRFQISNGPYDAYAPFEWTLTEINR